MSNVSLYSLDPVVSPRCIIDEGVSGVLILFQPSIPFTDKTYRVGLRILSLLPCLVLSRYHDVTSPCSNCDYIKRFRRRVPENSTPLQIHYSYCKYKGCAW